MKMLNPKFFMTNGKSKFFSKLQSRENSRDSSIELPEIKNQ